MKKDYKNEVRERWGNTDAYREYETKKGNYIEQKYDAVNVDMKAIFDEFFNCEISGKTADSVEAQALVAKLQSHITANYYTCTDEILAGLGKMYACDERFKKNIDKHGEGTAEFAAEAIAVYGRKA